jgi:hypothetical protein
MTLGAKPMLAWIDKTLLSVEPSYQRTLSAKRSQSLIGKLAAGFCWAHCAPLIVAAKGKGWVIIDGQHRHQAALRRDEIKDLPCYVVDAADLKAQAQAFVAHNRDRVTLNSIALFHAAGVAAGEPAAALVVDACRAAGVEIPRTPMTIQAMAPNQTIATGVMARILELDGRDRLVEVLKLIRAAHPHAQGQLRGRTIGAVAVILRHGWLKHADLVKALQRLDGQKLEDAARALRTVQGVSLNEGFVAELLTAAKVKSWRPAIDTMRAEDKDRARAQIKSIYEARRSERAAAKAERLRKHEADKAARAAQREAERAELRQKLDADKAAKVAARAAAKAERVKREADAALARKKGRRAFTFTRRAKAPSKAKPAPVIIRGDVKVRRFENGSVVDLAVRSLTRAGVKAEQQKTLGGGGHLVDKWKVRGKIYDMHELIRCANEVRLERGEEPLISPKRRSA